MNKKYLPELDGIRAISILLVLATHMLPVGPKEWQLNHATGLIGMSLFFCLSGFLITRFLYENQNIDVFLTRRIARILPLLIVYAVVVAGLIHFRWDTVLSILLFYLNYSDSDLGAGAVGHLWSICIEIHFYLAMGLAVWLFGRKAFWLVPVAALVVLLLRIDTQTFMSIRTHLRVDEILSGSLLALIWLHQDSPWASRVMPLFRWTFPIFVVLLFLSSHPVGGELNYLRPYFTMGAVGSILFMGDNWVKRLMRLSFLKYIATISYALYIWHPLTYIGWLGEGDRWSLYLFKRPVSFALTFLLAHVSTFTFEKYFTDRARSISLFSSQAERSSG